MIAVLSRTTPFIAHARVGLGGKKLWVLKVRTLWGGERGSASMWRLVELVDNNSGQKVPPSGGLLAGALARLLRCSSLDEVPQLLQVILGDMALVGPRPLTSGEIAKHYQSVADILLSVRPGITGLWQVSGRSSLTYEERRALDMKYIERRTRAGDLLILARTVWTVICCTGV
jgi:exopolysaccharide production protein ExoY